MAKQGQWSMLHDVSCRSRNVAVKLRIIRAYRVPSFGTRGETLEILFHDIEGTRMHAQIPRDMIPTYSRLIQEGDLYKMRSVIVQNNYQHFKTCNHPCIMQFFQDTKMERINSLGFPTIMYDFKSFEGLQTDQNLDERLLIDVIGRVVGCSKEKSRLSSTGMPVKLIELTLEDNEGFHLGCTLWGEYAEEVLAYIGLGLNEPLILLIQLCRTRRYKGLVSVSSAYHATKLIFSGEDDTIADFKNKMKSKVETSTLSSPISLTPAGSSLSQEIQSGALEVITIEELISKTEHGNYWILATIFCIENYKNWFYLGCASCNCKVIREEGRFRCTGCKGETAEGNYRYRINVQVVDNTDHTSLTLWERECTDLIGRSSNLMRNVMAKRTGDADSFPHEEIEGFVKTKGLFQVSVKPKEKESSYMGKRNFGVVSLIRDPNIWSRYDQSGDTDLTFNFWDEDSNPDKEEIGSSNPPSVNSVLGQKRKFTIEIDEEDPAKRNLEEDLEETTKEVALKEVKKEK